MPTFYSEDLIDDEGNENETVRDLIDVANHRLYELLFEAWSKYRSMIQIVEERNTGILDRMFCLTGMDRKSLERVLGSPERLLRYTSLFAMKTRPAQGLEALLSDAFGKLPVRVVQRISKKGVIPKDQQSCLGRNIRLGMTSNLGQTCRSTSGAFRIELGPLSQENYRRFLPGSGDLERLNALTRLYLNQPLEFEVELRLKTDETSRTLCLGGDHGARLGLDTWIFSGPGPREFRTRFYSDTKKAA